jgi:hypothetical protein
MDKINSPRFLVDIIQDSRQLSYKLTKPNDEDFIKKAEKIAWVTWENERVKEIKPEIEIGTSLILDPQFGAMFTWQTTPVTEVVEKTDEYIIFRTNNSLYKLEKI